MRASFIKSSVVTAFITFLQKNDHCCNSVVSAAQPDTSAKRHHGVIEIPVKHIRIGKLPPSATPRIEHQHKETASSTQSRKRRILDLSEIFSLYGKLTDEPEDADADDYYTLMSEEGKEEAINDGTTSSNSTMWFNQTWTDFIPKSSIAHKTHWYELSHYIEPDSIVYDVIEGFLIAILLCLIMATCYNYCYYYCLIRCGLVEDGRIYKSLLHRKGRKVRQLLLTRRRGGRKKKISKNKKKPEKKKAWFSFLKKKSSYDYDRIVDSYNDVSDESLDSWDSDNSSSLSQDSALSLEYGDKEVLDDNCGENNEYLNDSKLEDAAQNFFEQQEKQEELKKKTKVGIILTKEQKRKLKSGTRSIGSRRSRRSRRSGRSRGTSVRSQTSSILSSDSGSLSSYDGSSSDEDDDHSLEMESAMMDLELAEKRMGGAC